MSNGSVEIDDPYSGMLVLKTKRNSIADTIRSGDTNELDLNKKGFLFARFTYSSTVYGGAENPDGTSNVDHREGPLSYRKFLIVSKDPNNSERYTVYTDHNGYAFMWLKPGSYTFIHPGSNTNGIPEGLQIEEPNSAWSGTGEFELKENKLTELELKFSSVGYAP
jgi:hypothetical protein